MRKRLESWATNIWYRNHPVSYLLLPLSFIFCTVVLVRRFAYKIRLLPSKHFRIPIIVVGNISVGGTGKTPLVIWIARFLHRLGYSPGIVSRGYGGKADSYPLQVALDANPADTGDEALMIAQRTKLPVVVGPSRVKSVKMLMAEHGCDVIISDDGLQHYALGRSIEIAVYDDHRKFGNKFCLPAGPLREPLRRLKSVQLVVCNGRADADSNVTSMEVRGVIAVNMQTREIKSLRWFANQECHVVAGIGNPHRFFKQLSKNGLKCIQHVFSDHHAFEASDILFEDDKLVIMTEKDAIKCKGFATGQHWFVPVRAKLDDFFGSQLLALLRNKYGS